MPNSRPARWRRFKPQQGLGIRFHDLRHTHATHLFRAGIHPKVVSERPGHASIGITLDTYSHVMPGMQEEAAGRINAGLKAALTDKPDIAIYLLLPEEEIGRTLLLRDKDNERDYLAE